MFEKDKYSDPFADLRRRAADRMKGKFPDINDISMLSVDDVQRLVHDLHVHQTELEIQNEELRMAQHALEESRNKYSDLYDFAPVGYFTLDNKGFIRESNLAGASLLNVARESIIGKPFHRFISPDSQNAWWSFQRRIQQSEKIETCEIQMIKHNSGTFFARLESILTNEDGQANHFCRTVVSDITDLKQAEQRIMAALEEKQVLLREVHHRVKNNLEVINSLLTLHSHLTSNKTCQTAFEEVQTRIRSMAVAHEILYQSKDLASLNVSRYVENLANHLVGSLAPMETEVSLITNIDDVSFGIDTAIPTGFILTELVTNCLKHAFIDRAEGEIKILLRTLGDGEYLLVVSDDGIGIPEERDLENTNSMGTELINDFVEKLHGTIEFRTKNGTQVRVHFKELEEG